MGQVTSVAGGGEAPELWRTIVADVTGTPLLLRPKYLGAPYGDAMLAAIGSGTASVDEVLRWLPKGKLIQPTTDQTVLKAYQGARERFWRTQRALASQG
jgi:xylulokinase